MTAPSPRPENDPIDEDVVDAAVLLGIDGWRVVPLRGKRPIGKDWPQRATSDARGITLDFDRPGVTGVGIVVPPDVVVIDVDPRNGGANTWAQLEVDHGPVDTLTVATGGHERGRHFYFLRPPGKLLTSLPGGIDVKSSGQVVAPPSVHPDTGRCYRWLNYGRTPIDSCPSWLVDLIVDPNPEPEVATARAPRAPAERSVLDAVNVLEWKEIWPEGWKERPAIVDENGQKVERWLRPPDQPGVKLTSASSANCWPTGCYVHSTSVEGLPVGSYSKAQVYAWALGLTLSELSTQLWRDAREVSHASQH